MLIIEGESENLNYKRVDLDRFFENDIKISTEEFNSAIKYLKSFCIDFNQNVLLTLDTTPEALVMFIVGYQRVKN
jgi:hypothetical protein